MSGKRFIRTGIIFLLQPYASNALKRAIKSPKIYFRDTGLACCLARWLTADVLKNSAVAGSMFETLYLFRTLRDSEQIRFFFFWRCSYSSFSFLYAVSLTWAASSAVP